jgi:hypothetical protein
VRAETSWRPRRLPHLKNPRNLKHQIFRNHIRQTNRRRLSWSISRPLQARRAGPSQFTGRRPALLSEKNRSIKYQIIEVLQGEKVCRRPPRVHRPSPPPPRPPSLPDATPIWPAAAPPGPSYRLHLTRPEVGHGSPRLQGDGGKFSDRNSENNGHQRINLPGDPSAAARCQGRPSEVPKPSPHPVDNSSANLNFR